MLQDPTNQMLLKAAKFVSVVSGTPAVYEEIEDAIKETMEEPNPMGQPQVQSGIPGQVPGGQPPIPGQPPMLNQPGMPQGQPVQQINPTPNPAPIGAQ